MDTTGRTHISIGLSRSWLLVAANSEDALRTGLSSSADQVILDIENGVAPQMKERARALVHALLTRGHSAWVRINDVGVHGWASDLDMLRGVPGIRGVVLAKSESAEAVEATVAALGGSVPVVPLIESAVGIQNAAQLARAAGVARVAFGSGDYRRDTGTNDSDLAMAFPRSQLVVASRAAGLPAPIDGPTVGEDPEVMLAQSAAALATGMTGRLCLSAQQAEVFNDLAAPSVADRDWAHTFLQEFEERGGMFRDGSDRPRLHRARRIQELTAAFSRS